jgi:hypothetical protein
MAYRGSLARVDVPDLGLYGVAQGEPEEVPDEYAAQMRAQGWKPIRKRPENSGNNDDNKDGDNA